MAERKAVNKYYPPDWDPSKGSINKHVGQHPLRERARKLSEGILIIRFEMPFNVWCLGCERHIARGVRFNAEKKQIGKYYSTPILSFRFKCPSCAHWIEMHTDPKTAEYLAVSGAKRKNESWTHEDNETAASLSRPDSERLATDPFFRLEHEARDQRRAQQLRPRLESIQRAKDGAFRDDWEMSQLARGQFREEKRVHQQHVAIADDIRRRGGLTLKLLPEHPDDVALAQQTDFSAETRKMSDLRKEVIGRSVFDVARDGRGAASDRVNVTAHAASDSENVTRRGSMSDGAIIVGLDDGSGAGFDASPSKRGAGGVLAALELGRQDFSRPPPPKRGNDALLRNLTKSQRLDASLGVDPQARSSLSKAIVKRSATDRNGG